MFLPRFKFYNKTYPDISNLKLYFTYKNGITLDYYSYTFLNETHNLYEIGWNNKGLPKLWNYNLHYFDFLLQNTNDNFVVEKQKSIINKWIIDNPLGKGIGWDPYPTSLRIVNWIKWHSSTSGLTDLALRSLWIQIQWLASRPEYHLLGNHLFVNMKALLFGCALFRLDEKSIIYKKALKILRTELDEQFLSDGGHFELSPMYHSLAMQDLLDLYQLASTLPNSFPIDKFHVKFKSGMFWLTYMIYENQELAHFNDSANGIAPKFEDLIDFAKKIGINYRQEILPVFNHFADPGVAVVKSSKIHLIADIGKVGPDYLPGHGHADTLSFELAVDGHRLIVNSGTSEYGFSKERLRQRSTAAHSTIEVDGQSSSDVWSGFRVARRASVSNFKTKVDEKGFEFSAEHNGFRRLNRNCIHKRFWKVVSDEIQIMDVVSGKGNFVHLRYFLHPDVKVIQTNKDLVLVLSSGAKLEFKSSYRPILVSSTYHDEFGISRSNKCLIIEGTTPFENIVKLRRNT
jgi:uncharacterized heparinase superfamily protein